MSSLGDPAPKKQKVNHEAAAQPPKDPIEWSWETVEYGITKGSQMRAVWQQELFSTYNEAHSQRCGEITLEDVQKWTPFGLNCQDANFVATSLSLITHTNVHTRDTLRIWNYSMGDNPYGTVHFVLADGAAYKLAKIEDNDLYINDDIMSALPEAASEDTRRVLAGVLKWYNAADSAEARWLAEEALGDDDSDIDLKRMAPSCDPDTWKALADARKVQ